MLQFHSAICEILGIPPVMSPLRLEVLAEREHFCCTELPAAVIEWFAIADVEIWFHRHTNQDNLVPIQDLGLVDHEQMAQGWLRVAWENQGVVQWFCKLDGSDNPSVWHDDDQYDSVAFAHIPWVRCSFRFSEFVFDLLAPGHYRSWHKGLHITATSPSLPDAMLNTLQSHFKPGPFTEQDGHRMYRFYNAHALITVSQSASSKRVNWTIRPFSPQSLRQVLDLLQPDLIWLERWEAHGWRDELGGLAGQWVLEEYRTRNQMLG